MSNPKQMRRTDHSTTGEHEHTTAQVKFFKMHSLGNDFLVLDRVSQCVQLEPEMIKRLADRKFGVGFDQLLAIAPPSDPACDFDYEIFNADGYTAEQCGNGSRCVARLAKSLGLSNQMHLRWSSAGGIIHTFLRSFADIETWMPKPNFSHQSIPFISPSQSLAVAAELSPEPIAINPVSMGNPHGVIFVDDVSSIDVKALGMALSHHEAFPKQANIGFCQVLNKNSLKLRVFERGAGETLACGTGACAAVAVCVSQGLVEGRIKVSLPGGELYIEWPDPEGPMKMIGDAQMVYEGTITLGQ